MASDWIKRPLPDLDLYLAWSFRGYESVWPHLVARGVDPDVAERTLHKIISEKSATLEAHTRVFGPPTEVRGDSYLWSLTLWPDHQWLAAFYEGPEYRDTPVFEKFYRDCRIVRRQPGIPGRVSPLSIASALGALRLGYDTSAEVEAALGESQRYDADSWWPWESWEYDVPDGSVLQCTFVHNILVDITPERLTAPISRQTHPSPTDPPSL